MTKLTNHSCSAGCTCAACREQTLANNNELPHWRRRRFQRLGNATPPSHINNEWEEENVGPHLYFRQRKVLRHQPNFSAIAQNDVVDNQINDGLGDLVTNFLKGQGLAAIQLATLRRQFNLPLAGSPEDRHTLAKLKIGDKMYYGINAHGSKVFLKVNIISRTHAEGDIFNQAGREGPTSSTGALYLDRPMCRACGVNGAVTSMARQIGLQRLIIIEPGATMVLNL